MKFENINHPTVATLDINGIDVSIKSRPEKNNVSGWAVIAFTPACSIRCQKIHRQEHLTAFCEAVAAAAGSFDEDDADAICAAVLSITLNPPID
jgi:endogenous inhibitor of DNA gyrase (YacG/DUF329 family)